MPALRVVIAKDLAGITAALGNEWELVCSPVEFADLDTLDDGSFDPLGPGRVQLNQAGWVAIAKMRAAPPGATKGKAGKTK